MPDVSIAVRFLHLAASLLPLGIFAFVCLIGRPALEKAGEAARAPFAAFEHRLWRMLTGSLVVVFVTGLAGFVLQAAVMTGLPPVQSLEPEILGAVLATQYGKVWLARQILLAGIAGVAAILLRGHRHSVLWRYAGFLLAAGLAACMALAGHAAAGEGMTLVLQLGSDALHLLAAGIWLGALLPLALLLEQSHDANAAWAAAVAKEAARRFSWLGLATVGTLLITGSLNAWQLVGDVPPLVGTPYGRLLLVKLALLVPLLALAAVNLLVIRPRMPETASFGDGFPGLVGRLRRNTLLEAGLGAGVLLIVAMLGVTAPARHVQPEWPFNFRYSWEINKNLPEKRFPIFYGKTFPEQRVSILVGAGLAALALIPFGYALLRRRYRPLALGLGIAGLGGGAALALPALWVDAYPTTYRRPAVPYQAISVQSGLQDYLQLCVPCHGVGGFGDGPAGAGLTPRPADLTARHTGDHTAGDLFWWLSHGKDGTAMPGFQQQLSEESRWDLINFLRTLSAAEQARAMAPLLEPPWLVAPDFVYRTLNGHNKNLKEHRGQSAVLLVLFTWPQSQTRLAQLAGLRERFAEAGVALLAIPSDAGALDAETQSALTALKLDPVMDGSQEIFATYALFRRSLSEAGTQPDPPIPSHMEFLIDRQGYVRARWIAGESRGWSNADLLLREIARLNQEKPSVQAPDDHVH
ncbi:MAG TPA: CopD family protein [Xanthobacteraceae bacterium]|nr:CopD family protein [Xanthobacteraceae bacterium]